MLKKKTVLIMIQKLHLLFDLFEINRSRGHKVTDLVCGVARKVMEYIALRSTEISEENGILKTKLLEVE